MAIRITTVVRQSTSPNQREIPIYLKATMKANIKPRKKLFFLSIQTHKKASVFLSGLLLLLSLVSPSLPLFFFLFPLPFLTFWHESFHEIESIVIPSHPLPSFSLFFKGLLLSPPFLLYTQTSGGKMNIRPCKKTKAMLLRANTVNGFKATAAAAFVYHL